MKQHLSPTMMDTQVLVYGTAPGPEKEPAQVATWRRDCRALLRRDPLPRVCTVTLLEISPFVRAGEQVADLLERLVQVAFDGPAQQIAHELVVLARGTSTICPSCLGSRASDPCKVCENNLSRQQRMNDIMILATAAATESVHTLYTTDNGILHMRPFLTKALAKLGISRTLSVEHPPNSDGALFEIARKDE